MEMYRNQILREDLELKSIKKVRLWKIFSPRPGEHRKSRKQEHLEKPVETPNPELPNRQSKRMGNESNETGKKEKVHKKPKDESTADASFESPRINLPETKHPRKSVRREKSQEETSKETPSKISKTLKPKPSIKVSETNK